MISGIGNVAQFNAAYNKSGSLPSQDGSISSISDQTNIVDTTQQSTAITRPDNLQLPQSQELEGQPLASLELSESTGQETLNVPDQLKTEVPRAWTIMGETMQNFNDNLQQTLEYVNSREMSYDDRMSYLKNSTIQWVEDKRQNDPEMFVSWLKINEHHIAAGEADLIGLPADFSMEDYLSYIKGSVSTWV